MIFDSVGADVLYNLIQTNRMPYLRKYICNRAAVVNNCFTSIPTNTVPGHYAILTGTYADKHHLPAMKFWNLKEMRYRDYSGLSIFDMLKQDFNSQIKMIYEFFPYSEGFTLSSFAKGANYTYLIKTRMILFYLIQKLDYKIVLLHSMKTFIRHLRKNSNGLYVLWLPISDLISHEKGPDSPEFLHHLEEIDQILFKRLFEGHKNWEGLIKLGLAESTYFAITADHGSFVIQEQSELIQNLKPIPLRIKNKQASLKTLNQTDVLVAYTDGFGTLYLRNPITKSWKDKIEYSQLTNYLTPNGPVNFIDYLLKLPSVSHVFVKKPERDSFSYLIFSQEGLSQIQKKIESPASLLLSYQVLSGKDPLSFNGLPKVEPLMDSAFHPFQQWLNAISETNYPMILDQIPRLFACETMGDILFMGKEGYSFTKKEKRGTHDTGVFKCSRVPLIMAGPSIKPITIPTARTVDIVPTLLYLLNKTADFQQFDGRVLKEIMQI